MNILRLTPHYYFETTAWPSRFDPMGGMQVQITNLTEWLAKQGVRQDVLTTGIPGIPRTLKLPNGLTVHSVRFMTLPFKSSQTGTLFLDQSWFIGAVKWIVLHGRKQNYDAIHVHASGVVWPLLAGMFAQKFLKKPLILTIHCSRIFTYKPMNPWDRLVHDYVKSIELKSILLSHKAVVLTEKRLEGYNKLLANSSKMIAISDCIGTNHLSHSIHCPFCKKLKVELQGKKTVLFLGRIAHEKGWVTFVKVAKELSMKLDNLQFIVCGDGPQREAMEEQIESAQLQGQFQITGFVSHKFVSCYLHHAHLFILPSYHEEFGGSLIEAAIAGVPIISTNRGGPADIFTHGETAILTDPTDVHGIAEEAYKILTDEQIAQSLRLHSKPEVVGKFLPHYVYPNYLKLYNQNEVSADG
ncbi:glycosyltransferase [Paenibacillus sp. MZ04-78.2]|uniref:glycosyltransferase n=1 Tax=Paenibacillus sp. MZ04-78.2 TaxID=2962034 RepID=UPI0020B7B8F5|nr:glycosyltransferase [Paenibacillus sp. MZ04-78.2]MCP3776458.1 glycosyltransferase [Paenibacillus sp. MZ04-78.2]